MRASPQTTPYEVVCHRCNVTFPVGSKHCVHCGGRLGRPGGPAGPVLAEYAGTHGELFPGAEEAEDAPRRSPFSPVTLLWVLLFAGGTIYRACSGG